MPARTLPPDDLPEASPMIISSSATHIVVALEISRAALARHRRFLDALCAAAAPESGEPPFDLGD
jgi:hypothetical protein